MEDLYPGNAYGTESGSVGYAEILSRMEKIDEELRKVHKKRKKGKKGGKKKKLRKRLKALEAEHEQLKYYLQTFAFAVQQGSTQQRPTWWQGAIANSLPKLFDMGTVVLNNTTQKRPQIVTEKNLKQLLLTDGSDKK